jgi:DNA segregation ATPase FtsK/SpoIIIE, S-DNA-T family
MSINLQISEVQELILRVTTESSATRSSGAIIRRIFNETVADLLGSHRPINLHSAIEEVEPSFENWERALISHTYHRLIGPRIQQQQALLHHLSEQVLTLWDATQEFCSWLAGLLNQAYENGDDDLSGFEWLKVDGPVIIEIGNSGTDPGGERVVISGQIDQVWQSPLNQEWVLIDLQTTRPLPIADRLEACLTHLLLQAAGESLSSTLGVKRVSFTPTREETVYPSAELMSLRGQLFDLVCHSGRALPAALETSAGGERPTESGLLIDRLLAVLREFGLSVQLEQPVSTAPAFLRVAFSVNERLRSSLMERLGSEIRVQLKLDAAPRITNDGGRLVIDLQRPDRQTITFDEIRDQIPVGDARTGSAAVPLGIDPAGRLRMIDFSQPEDAHLLIAGAVGSGKSTWLRAALAGLLHANSPSTLRLILIDPQGDSFAGMEQSPYLHCPVIGNDGAAVVRTLTALGDEMERRYRLLDDHRVDSLESLIGLTADPLPRIFCLWDECADLILNQQSSRHPTRNPFGRSIEAAITRLGQRARATGIHLILATSQPGREIVRGVIDANFPARIGLRMNKVIESKLVLNQPGAEILLEQGDLLFRDIGELTRLQGIWIATDVASHGHS